MIPVSDDQGRRRFAVVSVLLASVWVITHFALWRAGSAELAAFERQFGLDRTVLDARLLRIRNAEGIDGLWHALAMAVPFLSYKLLHGGPIHLVCNVFAMHLFGGRLEQRAGALRFLVFHELAGITVAVVAILRGDEAKALTGASGAVAASVAAYLVLHGRARVRMLFPVVVWPVFIPLPAVLVALGWVVLHVPQVGGLLHLGGSRPVGWLELAAGAVAGLVFLPLLIVGRSRQGGGRR